MTRAAVIGHVEWVTHARSREPVAAGGIMHLRDAFDEPGGGGGVAARALPGLGCQAARFYTALAGDEAGRRSGEILRAGGVEVCAAARDGRQNRVLTVAEPDGERTIFVLGPNAHPTLDDPLPWDDLAGFDAVFYTGDDPRTLVAARAARVVVATARRLDSVVRSGVRVDVLIGSGEDPSEQIDERALPVPPAVVARTHGAAGGEYATADGGRGSWSAAPVPGDVVDTYGAGDVFMVALAVALARDPRLDAALGAAARAAAAQLTRRGGAPAEAR
jgi:ribokinase